MKSLIASIPAAGGTAPAPNANGVYEFPMGDKTVYVKQKGTWAVFSNAAETLDSAPADPTAALAELTKKYLLSVRGSVQNVPAASRENALNSLHGLVADRRSPCNKSGSEEEQAMMAANVKQAFEKLREAQQGARHAGDRRGTGPVEQGAVPGL